ncbi:hypothetical protein OIU77_000921 [Salix suchowensis]|uniref:SWEET sugar transporter n=1 Tax=Salix suchowensis TaxID=1278906 RepID=A0ABQ9B9T8_9ROSI|nr:hypothetical protein OIU77_000921 [Salix suchowensis]KAJ6387500.1 hypothetical protein OIU78_017259 [Salix suchowensis]
MGDTLRLAVGIMGNAASLLLFSAPILTFYRVIRKKSTEEFSCVPYIIALLNCLLYTWYGLPVVSYRWENFPVATINGLGDSFRVFLHSHIFLVHFIQRKDNGCNHSDTCYLSFLHHSNYLSFCFT